MQGIDKTEVARLEKTMNATTRLRRRTAEVPAAYLSKSRMANGEHDFELRGTKGGDWEAIFSGESLKIVGTRREAMAIIAIRHGKPFTRTDGSRWVLMPPGEYTRLDVGTGEDAPESAQPIPATSPAGVGTDLEPAPTLEEIDHEDMEAREHPDFAPLSYAQVSIVEVRFLKQETESDLNKKFEIGQRTQAIIMDAIYNTLGSVGPHKCMDMARLLVADIEKAAHDRANLDLEEIERGMEVTPTEHGSATPPPKEIRKIPKAKTVKRHFSLDRATLELLDLATTGGSRPQRILEALDWAAMTPEMSEPPVEPIKLKGSTRANCSSSVSHDAATRLKEGRRMYGSNAKYLAAALRMMAEERDVEVPPVGCTGASPSMVELVTAVDDLSATVRQMSTLFEASKAALARAEGALEGLRLEAEFSKQ